MCEYIRIQVTGTTLLEVEEKTHEPNSVLENCYRVNMLLSFLIIKYFFFYPLHL